MKVHVYAQPCNDIIEMRFRYHTAEAAFNVMHGCLCNAGSAEGGSGEQHPGPDLPRGLRALSLRSLAWDRGAVGLRAGQKGAARPRVFVE